MSACEAFKRKYSKLPEWISPEIRSKGIKITRLTIGNLGCVGDKAKKLGANTTFASMAKLLEVST
jgi:hypothetical protein